MVRFTLLTLLAGVLVFSLASPTAARKPPPNAEPPSVERIAIDVTGAPKLDSAPPRSRLKPVAFEYRGREGFAMRVARKRSGSSQQIPLTLPSPTVVDGVVIISGGIAESQLIGIDAKTGKRLWTTTLGDNGPSTLAVGRFRNRTRAVVNTQSCTTYSITPRTGKMEWSRLVGPSVLAAPAISGDRVYAAHTKNTSGRNGMSAALSAMAADSGKIIWTTDLGSDITGAPVVAGGRIYVTEMSGTVACFDLEGKMKWRAPLRALNAPVADAAGLFVAVRGSGATGIVRLDPKGGKTAWRFHPSGASGGIRTVTRSGVPSPNAWSGWAADPPRPVVLGGRLVVAGYRDLSILDTFTGKEKTRMVLPQGMTFSSPPAVAGKTLLYGTAEGLLLEIDPDLRAVRRVLDLGARIPSQPVLSGGMLYVMAGDCLYGIPWFKPGGPSYPQWGG